MTVQDSERSGYVLAPETLSIHSKELNFFRRTLRLFGFWHPHDACFIERIVYPFLINMLLLCILVLDVYSIISHSFEDSSKNETNVILRMSTSITCYIWAWLCHTFAVKYFKGRNLEKKLFNIEIQDQFRKEFNSMIYRLNWTLAASVFNGLISFAMSIVISKHSIYPLRWIAVEKGVNHSTTVDFSKPLTYLISTSDLYSVPTLLCLTWLMYLLSKTAQIRLLQLKHEYMSWNQQAEQAIFRHYTFYTKQIESNCKALRLLFINNSVIMIIMAPQQFYLCVGVSKTNGVLDLVIFLYYFLIFSVFWGAPLYFAESLKRDEEKFHKEINNFSPQYIKMHCTGKASEDETNAAGTFGSRTEVNKLTSYLKGRKSGFLVGFYSFQLRASMVSFYIGLLMFIIRIMSGQYKM